jgi:hypothetical protein
MRFYIRCYDCLSVSALDNSNDFFTMKKELRSYKCLCNGNLELMGHVQATRLVTDSLGAPCDGRCTNAKGPICDCHCFGANHGTQKLVVWTKDAGGIPKGENLPVNFEEATWYHSKIADIKTRLVMLRAWHDAQLSSTWDSNKRFVWNSLWSIRASLKKAEYAKTHKAREKWFDKCLDVAAQALNRTTQQCVYCEMDNRDNLRVTGDLHSKDCKNAESGERR